MSLILSRFLCLCFFSLFLFSSKLSSRLLVLFPLPFLFFSSASRETISSRRLKKTNKNAHYTHRHPTHGTIIPPQGTSRTSQPLSTLCSDVQVFFVRTIFFSFFFAPHIHAYAHTHFYASHIPHTHTHMYINTRQSAAAVRNAR